MNQPRSIKTSYEHDICDVCARTLLRGEQTEPFIGGARRYNVCELCKPHALQEGWMREGTIPDLQTTGDRVQRRRSLLRRRRGKSGGSEHGMPAEPRTLDDELSTAGWGGHVHAAAANGNNGDAAQAWLPGGAERGREPRHVHAIPTSGEHQINAAIEVFNHSQHRRTVAGVARSLGAPAVTVSPDATRPGIIWIVVAWELCWYRYEVDLTDTAGNTRLDGQGYELDELGEHERIGNASSDESGALILL